MSKSKKSWFVYVLRLSVGSTHCGVTTDLERCACEHGRGLAWSYTRSPLPVAVACAWNIESHSVALRKELAFTRLSRKEKLQRITVASETRVCSTGRLSSEGRDCVN